MSIEKTRNNKNLSAPLLLLSQEDAAAVLGISVWTFNRYLPQIIARHGLKTVRVGQRDKFAYSQLVEIVEHCLDTGEPLYESEQKCG